VNLYSPSWRAAGQSRGKIGENFGNVGTPTTAGTSLFDPDTSKRTLTSESGAKLAVTAQGVATHLYASPDVLVIGAPGAATAPIFSIDATSTPDLANNDLFVSSSSQISSIQTEITTAYAGGAYNKPGITSSSATVNPSVFGVGYDTGADFTAANNTTTFDGQTVASGSVLVKYTLLGDATLAGTVGLIDYNRVLANYNTGTTWAQGAVHPGSVTGLSDYNALLANYNQSATPDLLGGDALSSSTTMAATTASTVSSITSSASASTATAASSPSRPTKNRNGQRLRRSARLGGLA
jgi:hypothetical protein